ncbi:FAD-dependent oxidoreductase [Lentibacillus saliphilus]|uniref:FAD-dependent oxidoreductase n=1 Tax=Lentibacillus saliphilus TaxID=2737028 RepID=UPI001C30F346|nr:FAD-dependent oxidoreductase [Lentibacillus saliphilus]
MAHTIVIVGAIAGGATTAAQLRRMNDSYRIIMIDQNDAVAVSTCGLPYYVGNVIGDRDELYMDAEQFSKTYDVDVWTNTEVIDIQSEDRTITYQSSDGTETLSYDKLVLSPGASAVVPELPGLNEARTFTLHDLHDMDRIKQYIHKENPEHAVIVGAGFVGLETAENLVAAGINCTLIDRSASVLKLVDPDMGNLIQAHLEEKGIHVILEDGVASFSDKGQTIHLNSGHHIKTDMTILAVGIKPNTKLAQQAGLTIGTTGAIQTNAFMQTNDRNIYAIGDAVETTDAKTGTPRHVALAALAHRQAYIVACHIAEQPVQYNGTIGTAILKIFDIDAGAAGLNSAALDTLNKPYVTATLDARSHAGYYPGAEPLSIKIIFDASDGTLYGGQVVGRDGVDKRLAVLATAIKGNMTVTDLTELELGYAPPFSAPKDPLNIIGYKAQAMLSRVGR